jgi:geranylgeranyl reductase family protein
VKSLADVVAHPNIYDVVIVGAGPSGSSCAYWLAQAGWSVCLVEKKHFPREKTCGDGLTPRSVHQIAQMGLEGVVAANGHRYQGLRAYGFGASLDMQWPEHPVFPNYGYTITRFNLDGLVAEHAEKYGADVLNGVEALSLVDPTPGDAEHLSGAHGVVVKDKETGQVAEIRGRYLVAADGQNSRLGRELGVTRNRDWPLGMALRGYYTSERHDEEWIVSHLDIRDASADVVPGYGWIFPLGDGRLNVGVGLLSTGGKWKGVNTTKLQELFVAQVGEEWGLSDETSCGAPTGGRLPMGLSIGPRVGANTLTIGDAAGSVNPFNGEGISYGYETGRLAAGVLGETLLADDSELLGLYEERLNTAYGDYYQIARAFVRLISDPKVMQVCVSTGFRIPILMRELLKIMANLMSNDSRAPGEMGYRAMQRLAGTIPEQVWNVVFPQSAGV